MLEPQTATEAQTQLLQRVAARDLQALALFYDQTAGPLFSLAARILADAGEAEEVVQDVFLQIWEKAPTFDPMLGSGFHWALSITRHRAIDRLRSRQRRVRLAEALQNEAAEPSAAAPGPNGPDADEIAATNAALNSLPPDQREAIELAFFGGKTHVEIAAALNTPLGTIKARIRRGLLGLRQILQKQHDH